MITKDQYLEAVQIVKQYREQLLEELREVEEINQEALKPIPKVKIIYDEDVKVKDVNMPTKIRNIYRGVYGRTFEQERLKEITAYTKREVLRFRNVGSKTADELEFILAQAGLTLKQ